MPGIGPKTAAQILMTAGDMSDFPTAGHLASCKDPAADIVSRAGAAGVSRMVTVGDGLEEAEQSGYDLEYLCQVFGVGYETVASRLSTLQRLNQAPRRTPCGLRGELRILSQKRRAY